jgi:hypothetical protein
MNALLATLSSSTEKPDASPRIVLVGAIFRDCLCLGAPFWVATDFCEFLCASVASLSSPADFARGIVAFIHDLETVAPPLEAGSQLKDVCLGFCFDPLAAMGNLCSNHRCFDDGRSVKRH